MLLLLWVAVGGVEAVTGYVEDVEAAPVLTAPLPPLPLPLLLRMSVGGNDRRGDEEEEEEQERFGSRVKEEEDEEEDEELAAAAAAAAERSDHSSGNEGRSESGDRKSNIFVETGKFDD